MLIAMPFGILGIFAILAVLIFLVMYPMTKRRIRRFKKKYVQIGQGMTKTDVMSIMGTDCNISAANGYEYVEYLCKGYSAFERELLAKKGEEYFCVKICLLNNSVVSYEWYSK
ncbi:MAG: hypothetical protein J6A55_03995 [Oscillospiraceae bacterium]|nr:hypothetical protein [Oscillospiraceae bacterium]